MKNFGVKFFICSSTNEYNKRSITINSHIGTLNTNFYSVAMEDFCHLKINYDEINTNKSEYRKMPKMNEEIKEEHNLKLATETDSKNVFSRIQQENSWLSYLDEITFDTNMDIKIDTEPISCGICDSTRNPSNVMIKSNPFSSIAIPANKFALVKKNESMSINIFGFNFTTTRPTAFTVLFGEVINV